MSTEPLRFIQAENLVTRQIVDETVIVPIGSSAGDLNAIFTLNPVGTKIWEMLGAAADNDLIVQSICEEYAVTPEEAEKDLVEFQDILRTAGLIRSSQQSRG
jgi:hypothetical protein